MAFKTVGLIGKPEHEGAKQSLQVLLDYLLARDCHVLLEEKIAPEFTRYNLPTMDLVGIGEQADLAIVVGGDGNMLGAARVLSRFDISVVGVNRGNLGFLTDIDPDTIPNQLDCIFSGECKTEQRFLLEVEVYRHAELKSSNTAVNEVVLHHSKVAHMMEFEVYIDDHFAFSQRSDGLIVATPTGSTAYSLSGGGPILMPTLDALTLVPMFPHTLSARPIVVDGNSEVCLKISHDNGENLQISCDSHIALVLMPGDEIRIKKSSNTLRLIHPKDYSYFTVLRNKLGLSSKLY